MKKRNHPCSGFSLVEVTLAMGVVVFCLVTVLGLLAVGVNTTHVSTAQTSATNILNAVASDVEATPNITPAYTPVSAKGAVAETSPVYGITLPGAATGASAVQTIYIADDGQVATAATGIYQLNVWATSSSTMQQETFVRLLITWPASVNYSKAQGYVENVIAINRT
jgi:Tfp pilus assembly protein PilV